MTKVRRSTSGWVGSTVLSTAGENAPGPVPRATPMIPGPVFSSGATAQRDHRVRVVVEPDAEVVDEGAGARRDGRDDRRLARPKRRGADRRGGRGRRAQRGLDPGRRPPCRRRRSRSRPRPRCPRSRRPPPCAAATSASRSAAATLTGVAFSRSIDQAATSRAELLIDRPKRSNPGPPELTPTAVPCVASVLIAPAWPVRCGTPPLAKSCTPGRSGRRRRRRS